MISTAILIGNAIYAAHDPLTCCREDVAAMGALFEATGRFDSIHPLNDLDADAMREALRQALPVGAEYGEILFYFSGHGAQIGEEFFYCGTGFEPGRPFETGLSHGALHDIIRAVQPNLLVNIIDACFSGALLVKGDRPAPPLKSGFRNVLQFSSSLDSQTSHGGKPLSLFTRAFLEASLRKSEGPVYFSDISNALRDDFIDNDEQTPMFVSQGTAREILVDDAAKLEPVREALATRWALPGAAEATEEPDDGDETTGGRDVVVREPMTTAQMLAIAEARAGGPDDAKQFVDILFDGVLARFRAGEFGEYFESLPTEHSTYEETTIRDFMIRVLSREPRPDRMVVAEVKRVQKRADPWQRLTAPFAFLDPEWVDRYKLEMNCTLERAQLRLTLKPQFRMLEQLVLVLSIAPSLTQCYVFELVTQHKRSDWEAFDHEGREIVRRWYKKDWDAPLDNLIENICEALENAVRDHIAQTGERLSS